MYLIKKLLNLIFKNLLDPSPLPLNIIKKKIIKYKSFYTNNDFEIKNFGELNKNKIFYVIKRTPGTGLFSNVTFVLNHLAIANKFNYIPIVDMENYITIYNEKDPIRKNYNSWEYYFDQLSDHNLNEVYKSNKVIITRDKFFNFFKYNLDKDNELKNLFKNKIIINKYIKKISEHIIKKEFNERILGVHFRGTSYKRSAGHPFPATKKQMIYNVNKIMEEKKINKIFLATEEKEYLELFLNKFKNKIFYIKSSYVSNKNDAFKVYPRINHRYKLGRDILIETLLLSKCDYFIYINSNVSSAAIALNLNNNQERLEIKNGFNSKNRFISQILWYLKKSLPKKYGGFKTDQLL